MHNELANDAINSTTLGNACMARFSSSFVVDSSDTRLCCNLHQQSHRQLERCDNLDVHRSWNNAHVRRRRRTGFVMDRFLEQQRSDGGLADDQHRSNA
jgi:hypothetical protein